MQHTETAPQRDPIRQQMDVLQLPPDTVRLIAQIAARKGTTPEDYVRGLVERDTLDVRGAAPIPRSDQPPGESLPPRPGVLDFLDSLPPGPRSADSWAEIERQFQAGRDEWER